jgi:hypothetical protein
MYYNKLTSSLIPAIFLLLVISSVNFSSIKLVDAAPGDLVNYSNNFQTYTSPNDPNKDSAMQNADCVVNFMSSYVYTSSSAENCNNSGTGSPSSSSSSSSSSSPPMSPVAPSSQGQGLPSSDGPQTGMTDGSGVGIVRVVDTNSNAGSSAPVQSSSFTTTTTNSNPNDTNNVNVDVDNDAKDNDNDDDNKDKDKDKDNDAKDNDNDDDNKDKDNDAKVYNENTVNKEERKLLLTTCFERAYDKGNYLSTEEIEECAKNYIS